MLYSPSEIRTMIAYHAGTLLTRCYRKRDCLPSGLVKFVKIHVQPRRLLSATIKVIGWTLVCVSIHLECWLNKARVEIVTWAAVGVAHQQQFSYNSILACERDQCGFNSHYITTAHVSVCVCARTHV